MTDLFPLAQCPPSSPVLHQIVQFPSFKSWILCTVCTCNLYLAILQLTSRQIFFASAVTNNTTITKNTNGAFRLNVQFSWLYVHPSSAFTLSDAVQQYFLWGQYCVAFPMIVHKGSNIPTLPTLPTLWPGSHLGGPKMLFLQWLVMSSFSCVLWWFVHLL